MWEWIDEQRTHNPTEEARLYSILRGAEEQYDVNALDNGYVVAKVWMEDDDTV